MKSMIILMALAFAGQASAIATKKCPSELKIELKDFVQSGNIYPSKDNPNLPFAYIALGDSNNKIQYNETLKLVRSEDAVCDYRGEKISALIEGSLKKGAKKPAVIKSYFNHTYKGLKFGYVAYSPIKSISKEKTIVLSNSRSEVYFRGQDCNYGDCIPNYFRVGVARTVLTHDREISCFGIKKAQALLVEYLKGSWDGSEFVYDEDIDYADLYIYDLYEPKEIERYANTLYWIGSGYRGDIIYDFECAPSANCWGGFEISCNGEVTEWQEGED